MKKYFVVPLIGMLLIISCKDSSVEPELVYSGITVTNESGPEPIGNIDLDDWLQQWDYVDDIDLIPTSYTVYPAYANPTKRFSKLRFALAKSDSVVIVLDDKDLNRKTTVLS
ncbi:MAG: hypothetical protein WC879_16475 [Melioribacteraceae bacterium]